MMTSGKVVFKSTLNGLGEASTNFGAPNPVGK